MKYKECGFGKAQKMPRQVFVGLTVREGMRGGLWPTMWMCKWKWAQSGILLPSFVKPSLFFFYFFMGGKEHFLYLLQLCGVKTATKDGVAQSGDGIG